MKRTNKQLVEEIDYLKSLLETIEGNSKATQTCWVNAENTLDKIYYCLKFNYIDEAKKFSTNYRNNT